MPIEERWSAIYIGALELRKNPSKTSHERILSVILVFAKIHLKSGWLPSIIHGLLIQVGERVPNPNWRPFVGKNSQDSGAADIDYQLSEKAIGAVFANYQQLISVISARR